MEKKINPRFVLILLMIIATGCLRLLTVKTGGAFFNFTPIGAMALFGGVYFTQRWKAIVFPLLTLFLSDLIIQRFFYGGTFGGVFYNGWYVTYGVFILIVLGAGLVIKKVGFKSVLLGAVSASLAHYVITDFVCWLGGTIDFTTGLPYTRDWRGLMDCYVLALPFLKSFFMGTVIYSALLFGGFELAERRFPVLKRLKHS